jgi:hypothetical protein
VLWRAGLRIHEALALAEADLDPRRGSLLVRRGRGGRRREVGMDDWAWEQLAPWLRARLELLVGPPWCVVNGATRGRPPGGRHRPLGAAPRRPRGPMSRPSRATSIVRSRASTPPARGPVRRHGSPLRASAVSLRRSVGDRFLSEARDDDRGDLEHGTPRDGPEPRAAPRPRRSADCSRRVGCEGGWASADRQARPPADLPRGDETKLLEEISEALARLAERLNATPNA